MKLFIIISILLSSFFASADDKTCKDGFENEGMSYEMIRGMIPRFGKTKSSEITDFMHFMAFRQAGALGLSSSQENTSASLKTYEACLNSSLNDYALFSFYSVLANTLYEFECNGGSGSCNLGSEKSMASAIKASSVDQSQAGIDLKNTVGTWAAAIYAKSCPTSKRLQKLCTILEKSVARNGGTENKENLGEAVLQIMSEGF